MLAGDYLPFATPGDVGRHTDDTVGVMAGQVGLREVLANAVGLGVGAAGRLEAGADEALEAARLYFYGSCHRYRDRLVSPGCARPVKIDWKQTLGNEDLYDTLTFRSSLQTDPSSF